MFDEQSNGMILETFGLLPPNLFDIIEQETHFGINATGRRVGIVVNPTEDGETPIIRTTTQYPSAPKVFSRTMEDLVRNLKRTIRNFDANNVMVEIYTNDYKTMSYHTDASIDNAPNSYIGILTLYKNPQASNIREFAFRAVRILNAGFKGI
jgi:hypothetical protein